jgi:Glycosyl transferase family 2
LNQILKDWMLQIQRQLAFKYRGGILHNELGPQMWMKGGLAVFLFSSFFVFFAHQISFDWAVAHGLVVPDSVNISNSLQKLFLNGEVFCNESGFTAIAVLYGWTWFIHPALCFFVNVAIVLASAVLFDRVVIRKLKAPAWSVLGLIVNPYIILAMPGPNKEIPLLFLTLCMTHALLRPGRRWWVAAAMCIPIWFVRDGYGLLLLLLLGLLRLLDYRPRLVLPSVLFIILIVVMLYSQVVALIPALARNQSIYATQFESDKIGSFIFSNFDLDSVTGSILLYLIRIFYNLLTQALFPIFATKDNYFYGIGWAYWIFGIVCVMSWLSCLWVWLFSSEASSNMGLASNLAIGVWFMISLSLFVQPRYLMPMLPIAFGVLATAPPKIRLWCVLLAVGGTLLTIFIYGAIGRSGSYTCFDQIQNGFPLNSLKPNTSSPRVTWLLCTNSEGALLHRAMHSCLAQTMKDFELLLVVNGESVGRLVPLLTKAYAYDHRVKVVSTPVHLLNFSLSLGMHLAMAPFVARMDADDVSHPQRLERQLAFMENNDDVAVLGSSYDLIDSGGHIHGRVNLPETDHDIRMALRFRNPICHPAVMLRRHVVNAEGAYLGGKNAEDYDLWLRLARTAKWRFANLPEALLSYNVTPGGAARSSREAYANVAGAQLRQLLVTRDVRWLMGTAVTAAKSFFFADRP